MRDRDARGTDSVARTRGFDVCVRGGRLFSGDAESRIADVGITDGKIAAVASDLSGVPAREVIDAHGLVVAPGFIDLHAHSALRPFTHPGMEPKLAQGFTTEVIMPDGLAPAPVDPGQWRERRASLRSLEGPGPEIWTWGSLDTFLSALHEAGPSTSLVPSIGHNAVRDHVMGSASRVAQPAELAAMRQEVERGIAAGARMLSLGLYYMPGVHADTDEVVEVCRPAGNAGLPIAVHVRNEGLGVLASVDEMIHVARVVGAPLHLSHLKVLGHPELIPALLERIDDAAGDIPITFDQYPYGAGSTSMTALLPPWAIAGSTGEILDRLGQRGVRERIARDVVAGIEGWENALGILGPEAITLAHAGEARQHDIGRDLAELANASGQEVVDALCDLLVQTDLEAIMVHRYASDEDVETIFRHPLHLVGSDGIFGVRPHPRLYGTAARVLGRYAFQRGLLPAGEVIARLTSRPAELLGLRDRGRILPGRRADLVVLDPNAFVDTATYDDPKRFPEGVVGVWVAGERAWNAGGWTGARKGGVVR